MKFIRFAFGLVLSLTFLATASMAQNARTFVSGAGSDSNPCSLTKPCRTFGQAISVTNSGGEVVALTSGSYNPFTINKAITVEAAAGVYAGITVSTASGDGIDVNAGASDIVILRGLTVKNVGGNEASGIKFNTGKELHVESCVVNGFGNGVAVFGLGNVFVKDAIVEDCGDGINMQESSGTGTTYVAMDNVHLDSDGNGLEMLADVAGAAILGEIRNSSLSGNASNGIVLSGTGGGGVALNIESCLIGNNLTDGIAISGSASAIISNCTISNSVSSYDIGPAPSFLYSRGNNTINNLGGTSAGSLTPIAAR